MQVGEVIIWAKTIGQKLEQVEYLTPNKFLQNQADHCVYTRQREHEKVIIVIWVDDLIIAASDENVLNVTKDMLTARFKMKDMGKLKTFSWH